MLNSILKLALISICVFSGFCNAQISQPAGVYSNYITFEFEDPDYRSKVKMGNTLESVEDFPTYSAYGLHDLIDHRKCQEIPWAIVSDSVFFLNMRRHIMGDYYLAFRSLQRYTFFIGERIISKEVKRNRLDRGVGIALVGVLGVAVTDRGSVFKKHDHPNDLGEHYFLSLDDGMVYVLNRKNLLKICEDDVVQSELQSADVSDDDIPTLRYYLQRINFPDQEIEKPIILEQDEKIIEDNE